MAAAARSGRPLWLVTLADLSLLLVGFFVFVQATSHQDQARRAAIAAGIRDAFGGAPVVAPSPRIAVDANILGGFASGSAALPGDPRPLATWAVESARDPRTSLIVTGYADGSDADRQNGSALALAAGRAAAVVATLEPLIARERIRVAAALAPAPLRGRADARRVTVTISYDP